MHSAFPVTELAQLAALAPHHIWTQEYAQKRLRWKPKVALTAMVLRAYRLPEPKRVPVRPEYAGCKSWLASLLSPPLTEERLPLASLFCPPPTELMKPLAVLARPPLTDEREPVAKPRYPPLMEA